MLQPFRPLCQSPRRQSPPVRSGPSIIDDLSEHTSEPHHSARPNNYYASLVPSQKYAIVSAFTLDSGNVLGNVPVAYSTWGVLNEKHDNCLVLCHALTGSSNALDWWRPLMTPGNALDYTRYFIFCANVLGSPYGSASSLTVDPTTGKRFGPTFPDTTIRDDVR